MLSVARTLPRARELLKKYAPRAVFSVGGYAAVPISIGARLSGAPLALMEPNVTPGLANRLVGPVARRVYTAFEETKRHFSAAVVLRSGMAIRPGFEPRPYEWNGGGQPLRVLVLGGSQGARTLNLAVAPALAQVKFPLDIVHQVGRGNLTLMRHRYAELRRPGASVIEFIEDMASAIAKADLVISRAGGGAIAEICADRASEPARAPGGQRQPPAPQRSRGGEDRRGRVPARAAGERRRHLSARQRARQRSGASGPDGRGRTQLGHTPRGSPGRPRSAGPRGPARSSESPANGSSRPRGAGGARREGPMMFRGRVRHVHFIGVGGIGMSGLAEILRSMEFDVSGSDLRDGENTVRLARLGVKSTSVTTPPTFRAPTSSSTRAPSPGTTRSSWAAIRLGIPSITRAEMLAELMRMKYAVAIAGSHGKTTTTSLVATVLRAAGLDPTVVVGGRMASLGCNARLGAGDLLVAEADESDGSFLRLTPTIAVITNIDPEHLDFYGTHEALKRAFVEFAERVPFYGLAVLCLDHPHVRDLLPSINRRYVTYGESRQADYVADNLVYRGLETSFHVHRRGQPLGEFVVRMPGQHNVLNCLAVIAIADELEVPFDVVKEALATFRGVARRFTVVDEPDGISLVDDYGHHPEEIRATLNAARHAYGKRVLVAFQPHRYTRTRALFQEFALAFDQADVVFVTDVYAAGEAPLPGISGETLAQAIENHGHRHVQYVAGATSSPNVWRRPPPPVTW